MQIKAMFFSLIMISVLPFIVISMNHNVFFTVVGAIIVFASAKNLYTLLFKYRRVVYNDGTQSLDELEEIVNIDVKRFGIGIKIVKNLIIILFVVYCMFYVNILIFKLIGATIIIYWIKDCAHKVSDIKSKSSIMLNTWTNNFFFLAVNAGTIMLITAVTYIKITTELF